MAKLKIGSRETQNAVSIPAQFKASLLFVLAALLVFRVGAVPGIDPSALEALFDQQHGTILDLFDMLALS